MDPALWELLRAGGPSVEESDEVEAILRLDQPYAKLPGVRVVARFGPIVTCRLRRDAILQTHAEEHVWSLKRPRRIGPETTTDDGAAETRRAHRYFGDLRRPPGLPLTGRGVVVGIVDWGCDFDFPGFKHLDGSTRILALWDQRGRPRNGSSNYYGYGTIFRKSEIDRALGAPDPYAALAYHPSDADAGRSGTHGCHVTGIAASNGRGGGPEGVAPEADLIFVHLATGATAGLANLGDSSRILEAIDFIARASGGRPWVINLSVGSHGGPHDGRTLTEMAIDVALSRGTNRFLVQSTGNYYDGRIHTSGTLRPGEQRSLTFVTDPADITPNELEVWYSASDAFAVRVDSPAGATSSWVKLDGQADIIESGRRIGRLYHRARDPNNGDHHIDLFLYPGASPGLWSVTLFAEKSENGLYHAWLERDEACGRCQVRFSASDADGFCTTGTLANGRLPLVVGAYDAHAPDRPLASFSSCGPTRGFVPKPDLVAPGVSVLSARSAPAGARGNPGLLTRKSGTSMAAPHVAGAVALCLEGARRPLRSHEIRAMVLKSTDSADARGPDAIRYGSGYLNLEKLVRSVLAATPEPSVHLQTVPRSTRMVSTLTPTSIGHDL